MPSIRRRPNGTIEIRFFNSKRVPNTVSIYVAAGEDAELVVSQKILAFKLGTLDPWQEAEQQVAITLWQGWDLFCKKKVKDKWSKKTVEMWEEPIKKLLRRFGEKPCSWLTTKAGKKHIEEWRWPSVGPTTQAIYARGANSFLTWLFRQGYIDSRVKIIPPDLPDKAVSFILESEFYKLLDWFKKNGYGWAELPLLIHFYLGMRRNEIAYLKAGAIRFEVGLIHVGYHFDTKTDTDRFVPVPKRLRRVLSSAVKDKQPSDRIFDYNPSHLTHLFKKAVRDILPGREDVHLHSLRHSCAVYYLSKGSTLYEVSKLLGHKSYHTTEKNYANLDIEALRRMVR